jgi:HemY protein
MIRFILRFAIVAALAWLFAWLADRPGMVRVEWLGQRIEAPLVLAVLGLFACFVLGLWLIGLARRTIRAPRAVSNAVRSRRSRLGYESLSRGMIAMGAGDVQGARRHAQIAGRYLTDEPLARLLEAQTAQASGDSRRVGQVFEAMAEDKDTKLLGLRGLFNLARQKGDLARANAIAAEALKIHPGLPWASNAMLMIQSAEKNWRGAAETLSAQRRSGVIDQASANKKQAVVLTAQALEQEKSAPEVALQSALRAHKLDAGLVPAALVAGRLYAAQGQARKAARIVERTYALQPHVDLVRVYGFQKHGASPRERLKKVEHLISRLGAGEEGAVGLAEAALAAQEPAKAKEALAPFLEDRPRARICALMAEVAEAEGDRGRAREWLARGMRAPADPKWTADGMVSEQWQPVSPVSRELGTFQWKVPVERLPYEPEADEHAGGNLALEEPKSSEESPIAEVEEVKAASEETKDEMEPISQPRAAASSNPTEPVKSEDAVTFPLPDDPGPIKEGEDSVGGRAPDEWARRLAGSS